MVNLLLVIFADTPFPNNVGLAICHSVFVKGDHTNFDIEPSFVVEASAYLYLDVNYTTLISSFEKLLKRRDLSHALVIIIL